MSDGKFNMSKLPSHIGSAVMLLLAVAVVARVVYELLAPLLPFFVLTVALGIVYSVIFGRGRRL